MPIKEGVDHVIEVLDTAAKLGLTNAEARERSYGTAGSFKTGGATRFHSDPGKRG